MSQAFDRTDVRALADDELDDIVGGAKTMPVIISKTLPPIIVMPRIPIVIGR